MNEDGDLKIPNLFIERNAQFHVFFMCFHPRFLYIYFQ